jgi:hypothetical protein
MRGTFDPSYLASYWIRFCLGLISGLALSVMAADNALSTAQGATPAAGSNGIMVPAFIRPMSDDYGSPLIGL